MLLQLLHSLHLLLLLQVVEAVHGVCEAGEHRPGVGVELGGGEEGVLVVRPPGQTAGQQEHSLQLQQLVIQDSSPGNIKVSINVSNKDTMRK